MNSDHWDFVRAEFKSDEHFKSGFRVEAGLRGHHPPPLDKRRPATLQIVGVAVPVGIAKLLEW